MKVLLYTAITNNHDELAPQKYFEEDKNTVIKYRAYLDKATYFTAYHNTNGGLLFWDDCRYVYDNFNDFKRNCQIHKVLSHIYADKFDYSIWVDGSVILKYPISKMIEESVAMYDIALIKHSERDCIYKEAEDCKHFKLDSPKIIDKQMDFYRLTGFPPRFGLSETPVIIRKNTEKVAEFNNFWWSILCAKSKRDQLSFDYVRWKLGMKVKYFPGNIHNNPYFDIKKHKVLREHEK